MPNETLPNRASDAGPESKDPGYDWRDYLDSAGEQIRNASRAEAREANTSKSRNRERIARIEAAIEDLGKARSGRAHV